MGKKLNKKDLLSTNLATKKGYCTQLVDNSNEIFFIKNKTKMKPKTEIQKACDNVSKQLEILRKNVTKLTYKK